MRIASFNVESFFDRARALNEQSWAEGRPYLEAYGKINALLQKSSYGAADKKRIVALLTALGLKKSDASPYAILRQNRGHLVKRPRGKPIEVVADGRAAWIGWVELKTESVNAVATRNTGRVIADVAAEVQAVVEAEDRIALTRFNSTILTADLHARGYDHIMLIDGNDDRGIDVGILVRDPYRIVRMLSHVDDADSDGIIFSRDCPEYEIETPSGAKVLLLINHLKSKGFGTQAESNGKRLRQARKVREIYDQRRGEGQTLVAIVGDFNDTPDSAPLAPLLSSNSDLRDISSHPTFVDDGHPGTFGNGNASEKFDYILLSPALFDTVTAGGVFRKGVWGGTHGDRWPIYEGMTKPVEAASDHAAIWADMTV